MAYVGTGGRRKRVGVTRGLRVSDTSEKQLEEARQAVKGLKKQLREQDGELQKQNAALLEAYLRIEALSRHDPLTGVANRRWLDEVLTLEVERCRRYGSLLSAIMADLDRFKSINDSFGHLAGDKVLQAAAEVFRREVRMTDLVGRYGGEEFLFVLPNTGFADAYNLAERLRTALECADLSFREEPVTSSFGVAEWEMGDLVHDLIRRADEAMYVAKRSGGNRSACAPSTAAGQQTA